MRYKAKLKGNGLSVVPQDSNFITFDMIPSFWLNRLVMR
jgi:hypothetical protein